MHAEYSTAVCATTYVKCMVIKNGYESLKVNSIIITYSPKSLVVNLEKEQLELELKWIHVKCNVELVVRDCFCSDNNVSSDTLLYVSEGLRITD